MIAVLRRSKAMHNFGWLVADRGVRLLVGIVIGSWVARYLGKQDFGLLAYALALATIFAALTPMGMDALVVREIIRDPRQGGRWIGTTIAFRGLAAILASLLGLLFSIGLRPGDTRIWAMVAILGAGTLFQTLESGELWFQAHTRMQRLVLPRLLLFSAMSCLKVVAVLRGAGVIWFSVLTALEQVVSGVLTLVIARHALGAANPLVFRPELGWRILRKSWPLAISAISVILYLKLAQLILSGLMGDASLGIYAAAIRIPEAATFLPMVLASSLLPSLLRSREEGPRIYQLALQRFFRINALLALSICIPVSLAAPWLIRILYGPTFAEAGPILAVYVWSLLFAFLGVARGQHLLNELLTRLPLWFSGFGLAVNLVACVVLIPRFGAMGAAVSTVVSSFASAFLSSFIHPKTRIVGRQQWLALLTPWRIGSLAGVSDGI
ncbi:MAG TPA: flippase [Opitutaceae bacterium]|jgi:PST family polysaccharide transporter